MDTVEIFIDVNGPQKPNIFGRDVFEFDAYYTEAGRLRPLNSPASQHGFALGAKYIIENGWKMNY